MERWKKLWKNAKHRFALLLLLALAFLCVAPVGFLLTGSLMDGGELKEHLGPVLSGAGGFLTWRLLPQYPTLQNYVELLLDTPQFFVMFWNTVKISAGTMIGQLLVGVPAAWGLARHRFPGRGAVRLLYIILMIMPFQARMLSEYLVLDRLHILDSLLGIILPGAFSTFPVFIMYRFFRGIPEEVIEAARLDGAGQLQIFLYIGLPLGARGIVSAMVLSFLECWNLVEQPMTFLKDKTLWPLSLFLPQISLSRAGIAFTGCVVSLIPAVCVFLLGQDQLEQGIAASALKE